MAAKRSGKAMVLQQISIPARHGRAAHVARGQRVRVVNVHGTQVVDCWALSADNPAEFMSMAHTRVSLGRYRPKVGDWLVSNRRRKILKLVEDSSPGVHDTLLAACDRYRYELLGCEEYHRNCTDNFWESTTAIGCHPSQTPSPLNLWQNTPVAADGSIPQQPTVSKRGDHVLLEAGMDLVICLSCCPQDILPINGGEPRGARFEILG